MKQELIRIEQEMDAKIESLSIWNLSMQSILTALLYTIELIDNKGDSEIASDYISRLSLIYPLIKKYAQKKDVVNTTKALSYAADYAEDIKFLNSYAHVSMIMPQVHRDTLRVESINGKDIKLDYFDSETQNAEILDKLFCYISLHTVLPFNKIDSLMKFTDAKIRKKNTILEASDLLWVKKIHIHYKTYYINVHVLPNGVFQEAVGVSYDEYYSFISALKAFALYFICLARSSKNMVSETKKEEDDDWYMSEYMEWSVCCLDYKTLGFFLAVSNIKKSSFDKLISYYIDIISNETSEVIKQNSFCGDGYLPPLYLLGKSIIYSPHGLNTLLNINNILYSVNKLNRKTFDELISPALEPTLINQLEYIFNHIENIETKKNVNYAGSEIDLIVLSKGENTCLVIQVKTTIGPDSDCVSNIHYFGTVSYEKGLEIMANSDIIVALYEKTVLNNVYAAPNKYYEGLFLGKPILTTEGTLVGNKTEKGRTGFVIGESLRDLESFFICFDLQERIDLCSKNAREMWIDKYSEYVDRFMFSKYIPFIIN